MIVYMYYWTNRKRWYRFWMALRHEMQEVTSRTKKQPTKNVYMIVTVWWTPFSIKNIVCTLDWKSPSSPLKDTNPLIKGQGHLHLHHLVPTASSSFAISFLLCHCHHYWNLACENERARFDRCPRRNVERAARRLHDDQCTPPFSTATPLARPHARLAIPFPNILLECRERLLDLMIRFSIRKYNCRK